jgi:transposase InsO family protein
MDRQQRPPSDPMVTANHSSGDDNSTNPLNRIHVFTSEDLKNFQQQDNEIRKIIENIHQVPINHEYSIHEGLLCRIVNRPYGNLIVPVVPKTKVKDILLAYHNSSMNGSHFGKDRTYHKIRDRYYWSNMYRDIANHIKACSNCSVNKYSRRKSNGHLNSVDPPTGVWQNLAMDFIGPITPSSSNKNSYILVITDLLSKYVVTKATRDNSALTAARTLVEEVILKHGVPNQILTDNGPHFTAELFNAVTSLCGVCHVFTTPYHPQSNGVCERFNSSLCENLSSICNDKRTDWDQQLSKTTFAYNTSRHTSTKITPFELMYGRRCRLPFDLPTTKTSVTQPHQYLEQLEEYLRSATSTAIENIQHQQIQSKQRYNVNRSNEKYSVGDFVYMKRLGFIHKLSAKYTGPYQVIQVLNDCTYRIQNPENLRELMNVHASRIRRCLSRDNEI